MLTLGRRIHDIGYVEYRKVEFIPAHWLERAAACPGLTVYSQPVLLPVYGECRQSTGDPVMASIEKTTWLLREALLQC